MNLESLSNIVDHVKTLVNRNYGFQEMGGTMPVLAVLKVYGLSDKEVRIASRALNEDERQKLAMWVTIFKCVLANSENFKNGLHITTNTESKMVTVAVNIDNVSTIEKTATPLDDRRLKEKAADTTKTIEENIKQRQNSATDKDEHFEKEKNLKNEKSINFNDSHNKLDEKLNVNMQKKEILELSRNEELKNSVDNQQQTPKTREQHEPVSAPGISKTKDKHSQKIEPEVLSIANEKNKNDSQSEIIEQSKDDKLENPGKISNTISKPKENKEPKKLEITENNVAKKIKPDSSGFILPIKRKNSTSNNEKSETSSENSHHVIKKEIIEPAKDSSNENKLRRTSTSDEPPQKKMKTMDDASKYKLYHPLVIKSKVRALLNLTTEYMAKLSKYDELTRRDELKYALSLSDYLSSAVQNITKISLTQRKSICLEIDKREQVLKEKLKKSPFSSLEINCVDSLFRWLSGLDIAEIPIKDLAATKANLENLLTVSYLSGEYSHINDLLGEIKLAEDFIRDMPQLTDLDKRLLRVHLKNNQLVRKTAEVDKLQKFLANMYAYCDVESTKLTDLINKLAHDEKELEKERLMLE
ncbi:hypothetical protein DAMA08_033880 [Martiniozyma asiatica (nom. inval.)]|nr:hypothetical protein DAMA08_033880 [Martiniozyma asiatica]